MTEVTGVEPSVPPSGPGCVDCDSAGGWWVHLRRCAQCGHIGCCDTSPAQHASAHWRESGHPLMTSFEPGEEWYWDFRDEETYEGPVLAGPQSHPSDQPTPGPAGGVPHDWMDHIHR